ncbi:NAD(P)-dependent alcohol dehydrogenase [Mycobacterium sp. ACS4331]|uniref:NAD(P)-dependent alcohol dehydrogenase n=1 Tax=Mycobacterium sp. ACS4331 TaxID=1834121 RepID=UPI0007FB8739|nr:NAD(P)-dependent alcohol dehydrogenase [Mycobacterium sp. ACS4331]OBF29734.1 dehydrogenase [Mycobacterium sp. ACS4331]
MRALQIVEPGRIEVRDAPVPDIGPGEVLVKVAGAGVCHSDLHLLDLPEWPLLNMTLGHETAGHVAATGPGVTGFSEGDAVLVGFVWSCGTCRACIEGRDNVCVAAGRLSMPPAPGINSDGGMAEYIKTDARHLYPLGGLDPTNVAPLADAALTPMHAVNGARHRLTPGGTAVVIGVGGLGHMGVQILKATSGVRIIAVDINASKLDHARNLGADEVLLSGQTAARQILDLTGGYGADAVFDFVGSQSSVDLATGVVAPDGALRFVGIAGGGFTYTAAPWPTTVPFGVSVRSSYAGTRVDQYQVLELARLGMISVETTTYPLERAVEAFDDLRSGVITGRAVLVP